MWPKAQNESSSFLIAFQAMTKSIRTNIYERTYFLCWSKNCCTGNHGAMKSYFSLGILIHNIGNRVASVSLESQMFSVAKNNKLYMNYMNYSHKHPVRETQYRISRFPSL